MVPLALEDLLGDPYDLDPIQRILLQNGDDFLLPRIFPLLLFCNTPLPPNGVILLHVYPCVPEMNKQTKFGQSKEHCFILNLSNTADKKNQENCLYFFHCQYCSCSHCRRNLSSCTLLRRPRPPGLTSTTKSG